MPKHQCIAMFSMCPLEHCDSTVPMKGLGSSPSENDMTNPVTSPNPHPNTLLSGAQIAEVHPRCSGHFGKNQHSISKRVRYNLIHIETQILTFTPLPTKSNKILRRPPLPARLSTHNTKTIYTATILMNCPQINVTLIVPSKRSTI